MRGGMCPTVRHGEHWACTGPRVTSSCLHRQGDWRYGKRRWECDGRLAQLVERLLYTQDVGGSSPSLPTTSSCHSSAWKPGAKIFSSPPILGSPPWNGPTVTIRVFTS